MGTLNDPAARKAALIEAAKARNQKPDTIAKKEVVTLKPASECKNRSRIIFDNSGSMSGSPIEDAKKGVVEYLRSSTLNEDAVAIHLLEVPRQREYDSDREMDLAVRENIDNLIINSTLTSDLISLAGAIDSPAITGYSSTPLFQCCSRALIAEPQATRLVAFSDGEPDSSDLGYRSDAIEISKKKNIPIDTVYIGYKPSNGYDTMKFLAEDTGGIFLHFDPAKGVNFRTAFKYLSPGKRLMLMDGEFKAKLEKGEVQ